MNKYRYVSFLRCYVHWPKKSIVLEQIQKNRIDQRCNEMFMRRKDFLVCKALAVEKPCEKNFL